MVAAHDWPGWWWVLNDVEHYTRERLTFELEISHNYYMNTGPLRTAETKQLRATSKRLRTAVTYTG